MKSRAIQVSFSWRDLDLEIEGIYIPGDPGRCSGPPEKCYPPESPEIEINSVTCMGLNATFLLYSNLYDEIAEKAIEAYEDSLE